MRVLVHGEVRIRWPDRARRRLWPSRLHDLALFEPPELPVVGAARLAAARFAAISPRRSRLPSDARSLVPPLRAALVAADEAEFDAARATVGAPDHPAARALLAAAFTSVEEWTRGAAAAYLERPRPAALVEEFGPFVRDPELVMRLARASKSSPYGLRDRALDLLAHLGSDAVPPLRFMLFERWSDSSVRGVARALALVESEPAGRALLPLLAARPLRSTARAWAKRHPALARPILAELASAPTDDDLDMAHRAELRTVVEPLLRELDPPSRAAPRVEWPPGAPRWARSGPLRRPRFVLLERLPRLRTTADHALPAEATGRWLAALAGPEDAGLAAPSAADVASALYDAWSEHSGETSEAYVFEAIARAIDDPRVAGLVADAEAAHRAGRAARARRLLEAVAERATPIALMHVAQLAETTSYEALRRAAEGALAGAAERRGLGVDALLDRRAPTLGLDARGERAVDVGGRVVQLVCDARSRLSVRVGGRLRTGFPPARVRDDAERYAAAKALFKETRRELRVARAHLCARLERMMIDERTLSLAEFERHLASNPIVRPMLERVVLDVGGRRARLAEDGTLADLDDGRMRAPDDARVGVAHPLHLSAAERAGWSERLAEYELAQPFAQLGRAVFVPGDDELRASRALRFEGTTHPWRRVARLRDRGWTGRSEDGLRVTRLERRVKGLGHLGLELTPGLHLGSPTGSGPQRVARATIEDLASLTPVRRSEALRAVAALGE